MNGGLLGNRNAGAGASNSGCCAGGEVGASMSLLVESAPANRAAFTAVGHWRPKAWQQLLAGCRFRFKRMATVRHRFRNRNAEWGWRVPFFIGVLLAPIGCGCV